MKISHGTRVKNIDDTNGYGYATVNMIESLRRLGHEVNTNDPSADVEIWFDQPHHWKFSKGPYRIGYHPWESTELKPGWAEIMNQCDEIWTPSPLIADWYVKYAGIKVPVFVYEHGVDTSLWTPVDRVSANHDVFKFMHIGCESLRKGGSETMRAYRTAFPKTKDVELTMKIIADGWGINHLNGINIIIGAVTLKKLIKMYHEHHVFVYPSYGEGFGLTPLQAMATGMPTITCPAWAPYSQFLDPNISVSSKLIDTKWPDYHPGKVLQPNTNELVDAMRYAYDNYDVVHKNAQDNVAALTQYYDWDRLTKIVFEKLAERLEK